MTTLLRLLVVLLSWGLRRHVLRACYGYVSHLTARIGWSWIFPEELELREHALIERGNWITGFAAGGARHFEHLPKRDPALVMGDHSAITKAHHLDCTERVEIGAFTTIAGYRSQLLTHSLDLERNRQDAAPIRIGDHCLVGTNVVILGGAQLPDRSVLGAKALLKKAFTEPGWLYAGVPAHPVKTLPADAAYFQRKVGFVT